MVAIGSADLKAIAVFIAEDSPSVARRFVRSIVETVERLADFPESGRIVPEVNDPTIREVVRRPYRIVYRVDHKRRTLEIARVWHATRGTPDIQ